MPATIYLTTGLIGTFQRTWVDQIELDLLETLNNKLKLSSCFLNKNVQIGTRKEREKANIEIAEPLKLVPDAERQEQLR